MERKALLAMLVLSLRTNVREANEVLERLNAGDREQTFPTTLVRCYRTIEHDARVASLGKLADFVAAAKEAARRALEAPGVLELLAQVGGELTAAADAIEAGRRHQMDEALGRRLEGAVRGKRSAAAG